MHALSFVKRYIKMRLRLCTLEHFVLLHTCMSQVWFPSIFIVRQILGLEETTPIPPFWALRRGSNSASSWKESTIVLGERRMGAGLPGIVSDYYQVILTVWSVAMDRDSPKQSFFAVPPAFLGLVSKLFGLQPWLWKYLWQISIIPVWSSLPAQSWQGWARRHLKGWGMRKSLQNVKVIDAPLVKCWLPFCGLA